MKISVIGLAAGAAIASVGPVAAQDAVQADVAAGEIEAVANEVQDAAGAATETDEAAAAVEPMTLPAQLRSEGNAVLPANTEVLLRVNQDITTKGKTWKQGDTFNMTVVNDVMLGEYVVIPRGSRGVGRIVWMTSKGAFGKSGKMDVELEHVEVSGRKIAIDGTYRQEGEGNTLATVGGVVAAGPFAAFITGKSGLIPQGRELKATTESDLPLAIPARAIRSEPAPVADLAAEAATASEPSDAAAADSAAETAATDDAV